MHWGGGGGGDSDRVVVHPTLLLAVMAATMVTIPPEWMHWRKLKLNGTIVEIDQTDRYANDRWWNDGGIGEEVRSPGGGEGGPYYTTVARAAFCINEQFTLFGLAWLALFDSANDDDDRNNDDLNDSDINGPPLRQWPNKRIWRRWLVDGDGGGCCLGVYRSLCCCCCCCFS